MNHNVPQGVREILDHPMEDGNGSYKGFVTIPQCLGIQKTLEHRLTKLETQGKFLSLESLGILVGIILALLKLFW